MTVAKTWPDYAVREACEALGLLCDGWRTLRIGHCASVVFPEAGLVARVGRPEASPEHMAQEARFARRVAGAGISVLAPADGLPAPLVTGDGPVTFWPMLEARSRDDYDWAWLGSTLRGLHALPLEIGRPSLWDPLARVDGRVETYAARPDARVEYVAAFEDASATVRAHVDAVLRAAPPCVLHGDPGPGNTLAGPDGPVLVDFDLAGVGPAGWDLTLPFVLRRRLGLPEEALGRFLDAYGADPRAAEEFDVLLRAAELLHASFALIRSHLGDADERELEVRMRAVFDSTDRSRWGLVAGLSDAD